jgi:hypothetical protein
VRWLVVGGIAELPDIGADAAAEPSAPTAHFGWPPAKGTGLAAGLAAAVLALTAAAWYARRRLKA